ncbi:PfkB family carbohydrate kinase [Cellulomonas endophytica]|uniref:PfkB family carbohydrate kinase n=1 Tax=Cellulomonas endophytica TaxID=2494735 RepID=UPI0010128414|nr:PfkB family carbohydrate kinase [Cellulomonas endophytica]
MVDAVVVGQVARDLVLRVPAVPEAEGSVPVEERSELLGGKGANQGVGLALLGLSAALVGVVGDDPAGRMALDEARADGLDADGVVVRPGARTALLVDVVSGGERRLLEHTPEGVLLTPRDVQASAALLGEARAVLVQLQQPGPAVVETLRLVRGTAALVVADGAPADEGTREEVLASAHVLRADAGEAEGLVGHPVEGLDGARAAARELLDGPRRLVVLAAGAEGNVAAWPGGEVVTPLLEPDPVDTTGAGDATVAGLTAALLAGEDPEVAAWWGAAAAALTVGRTGGRPGFDAAAVRALADRSRGAGPSAPS